jgi:hypothetical protein
MKSKIVLFFFKKEKKKKNWVMLSSDGVGPMVALIDLAATLSHPAAVPQ